MEAIKRKRKRLKYSTKKMLNGYIFVAPWLIGFVMFFAMPVKNTIVYSFNSVNVGENGGINLVFNGIQNYIDLFVSEVTTESQPFQRLFVSENLTILTNLPLIVIFSLFLAIIANMKVPCRGLIRVIFFMPIVLGLSLIVNWTENSTGQSLIETASGGMFGAKMGANILLEYTFLPKQVVAFLAEAIANISQVITRTGVQTMIFLAGLQSISPSHYEVARIEGANSYDTFWKVTIPMLANSLVFTIIYTLIDLFLNSSIAEEVYNFAFAQSKIGVGSALSVVYIFNVFVALVIAFIFMKAVKIIEK